jgi:nucleotide-binding universal stress UspA family protein
MKILLLTDGSNLSLEAARWLGTHAGDFAAPVDTHLLFVQLPLPYPAAAAAAGRGAVDSYNHETSEGALAPAARVLQQAGVPFKKSWTIGEVVPSISEYARAGGFDLVVMSTHGRGEFTAFALGSVAARCMALLDTPILVVPRPH